MKLLRRFSTEENVLEIDQLEEARQLAARSPVFKANYTAVQDQIVNKKDDTTEPTEEPSSEPEVQGDAPVEESQANIQGNDDVTVQAMESLRNETWSRVSLEDFEQERNVVNGSGFYKIPGSNFLTIIGVTLTAALILKLFKGVIYLLIKIAKVIYNGSVILYKYMARHSRNFIALKKEIQSIKEALIINSKDNTDDRVEGFFTNEKVINQLKVGSSKDFTKNIQAFQSFIEHVVSGLDRAIIQEIGAIVNLCQMNSLGIVKDPLNSLKIKVPTGQLVQGSVEGYENDNDHLVPYRSNETMIGDVLLVGFFPSTEISELNDYISAYNNAKLFLAADIRSFEQVQNVNYMTVDQLTEFLDALTRLCDACLKHQSLYEQINRLKGRMKMSMRTYVQKLIDSKEKVSLEDSKAEMIYLKSVYVDKVYLLAAIDVHDYSIRVITSGITFARENQKRL